MMDMFKFLAFKIRLFAVPSHLSYLHILCLFDKHLGLNLAPINKTASSRPLKPILKGKLKLTSIDDFCIVWKNKCSRTQVFKLHPVLGSFVNDFSHVDL
jgi:hypothetical protein